MPPGAIPPDLLSHAEPFWVAFSRLSGDRPLGAMGGCGRIPYSSIERYVEKFYNGDLELLEEFIELLGRMDTVLIDHLAKQMEEQQRVAKLKQQ